MRRVLPFVAGAAVGGVAALMVAWVTHFAMSELVALRLRACIAFAALALSVVQVRRRQQKKRIPRWVPQFIASVLATLSVAAFYSFGNPVYEGLIQRHDTFHYFLGAKYAPELGYTRIYECTARAQVELGQRDEVLARSIRDLENDHLVQGGALIARPDACRPRFSAERWQRFVADVAWFRSICELPYWDEIQSDHGYNPTPIWTLVGRAIASLHAASMPFILSLAALDVLLCAGMFAALGWAFGWRTACLALIFWGAQVPASHLWLSGCFLRQDWIFFLTVAVCCLRRRRFYLAGICLALSTLLRVFPAVCLLGLGLVAAESVWRQRRVPPAFVRLAMGGLGATAVIVALALGTLGPGYFKAFDSHIRVHAAMPAANNMGVPMILMHDLDGSQEAAVDPSSADPWARWRQLRHERLRRLRPLHLGLCVAMGAAFAVAAHRIKRLWAVAPLSVVFLFTCAQLGCYYCIYFLPLVALARWHHRIEWLLLGTVGLGATLATMPAFSSSFADEYTTQSLLYFAFSAMLLVLLLWVPKRQAV